MKKTYYLFNPGRLSRQDNTLRFVPVDESGKEGQPRFLPVETIEELYVFGSLDANSAVYNFLGQEHICVHFFNYYEHYTGSFMPKDYLLAGKMQVDQTRHYMNPAKRYLLAALILDGASFNMLKVLKYYAGRGYDLQHPYDLICIYRDEMVNVKRVPELMGLEGNMRQAYYSAFDIILKDFEMGGRSKRPPRNEVNALISYCNMMCYTQCLKQLYHTQLNPTISFLHEPGVRRYSLALDLAEIFKPILVDRLIFGLLNKRVIKADDFRQDIGSCLLKPSGAKKVAQAWEERMNETFEHRTLRKHISYKHLIRLECYKLAKHIIGDKTYKPFRSYW